MCTVVHPRLMTGVLCALLLGACSGPMQSGDPQAGAADAQTLCAEPRPQVCTMQFEPTCGVLGDGSRKQYSSPCNACADDRVVATLTGACPE